MCHRPRSAGPREPTSPRSARSCRARWPTCPRSIRGEVELAKAEVGKSAKKAGIGAGAFGAAGVVLAFSGFFFGIALAEFLTWLGLERWISYLIVWFLLVLLAGLAALIGRRFIKKIEKPERTLETLHDLPEVAAPRGPGPAAPRRARGEQRPGRGGAAPSPTRSDPGGAYR